MKRIHKAFLFLIANWILLLTSNAQTTITLSGYVSDAQTGERLSGASVFCETTRKGAAANSYGFFSLTLTPGKTSLSVRFVGYSPTNLQLNALSDTFLNVGLLSHNLVGEVEVKGTWQQAGEVSQALGINRLTAKSIEKIPVVLGEPDLLKSLQLLPGVSFAGEGSTGFSVRGGSPDQTLILLDGVPVYNVNHLWGFMSLFNNDAISGATLYKGGLPARFGGRLSSVLDIQMKEGNLKESAGTFSLSPIAGRYTYERPLIKDKASFIVSARKTWLDIPLLLVQKLGGEGASAVTYGFWDINAKTNWIIGPRDRIYLSFYTGRDAFIHDDGNGIEKDYFKFSYQWQNLTTVLRWNHVFGSKVFANFSAYNSRFRQEYYGYFGKRSKNYFRNYNQMADWSVKGDLDWFPNAGKHFRTGFLASYMEFNPSVSAYRDDSVSVILNKGAGNSNFITEWYGEGDFEIARNLRANMGIRAGIMQTGEKVYPSFHPRIILKYGFSEDVSGQVAWSRMKQYLHQLQNTAMGIPTDLWVASTSQAEPGSSDLLSAGVLINPRTGYVFSGELYWSKFKGLLQYRNGGHILQGRSDRWEDFITFGEGASRGVELMAEKTKGTITGWVAYTLSKTDRRFEELNNGLPFPYSYDRRHHLNLYTTWFLGQNNRDGKTFRRNLSGNFNFASGNYITLATQTWQAMPIPLAGNYYPVTTGGYGHELIENVNNYQMPHFHHLNLSYQVERQSKEKTVAWNFSVYNVYNRLNPWYFYRKGNQLKQVSMFPIIPSISYTYKF